MNSYFQFKNFRIWHDKCALKTNTDGVVIGAWACNILKEQFDTLANNPSTKILDIGTGSGLISIMLAQETKSKEITGIDIDLPSIQQAQQNINESGNFNRIKILNLDFSDKKSIQQTITNNIDIIISNPPFYEEDTKCYINRINSAKHTSELSFDDLISGVKNCLNNEGLFFVIIPHSAALSFISSCAEKCLYLTHRCDIFSTQKNFDSKTPQRTLLCFSHKIKPTIWNQLTIRNKEGNFTNEFSKLTKNFYL